VAGWGAGKGGREGERGRREGGREGGKVFEYLYTVSFFPTHKQ